MRRSLHLKLVLIMVLLIISLMTVVGAFLMNSVTGYYINDFYTQMADAFGQENVDFVRDLQTATEGETDGAAMIDEVLAAYRGVLGVDGRNRNYYVLDGVAGRYLSGSSEEPENGLTMTPNITSALLGEVGFDSDVTADYMDAAIPITRGGRAYVVYILDNREAAQSLNGEMFTLILEALADNYADLPPNMAQNFLNVILNESDRMTHIVQDLLTLSRFDSGRSELNLTRFPFAKAVSDTYQAVLMEAQKHGHTIRLDMPGQLPEVLADSERVMQVMMNIVSNAIKYTPDGGTIVLSAGAEGDKVWMSVDDNGIGIPDSDRDRIFERFYRVDKARSRQSGGTGLGLSIAYEIMKLHEGDLHLVDKAGPGLTIRMELPVDGPKRGGAAHE